MKNRIEMYTYNIAATDGKTLKEYRGYRTTVNVYKDEKHLMKMVRTFVMSYFGVWYEPVVITNREIDLLELYKRVKDEPAKHFPVVENCIINC